MINKQRAGQTETQRSATHLSTCTVYQIFEHNDKHTNQDKYKQGHTKVCYTLSHCTSYLKTRINGQTKTNRQTKTKTNRDTKVCYTPVNLPSLPDIWRQRQTYKQRLRQTETHRGLLHTYQLSLCTSYLKTKINGQTKTNRQTKTRTNNEPEVYYTPVKFHSVPDIWWNRPWHVIECIMII